MRKKHIYINTGTFENYARSKGKWAGTPKSSCVYREGAFLKLKTFTR